MNNLTEAGVQLNQLESELPNLLTQDKKLSSELQVMTCDEIIRQMKYFQSFYDNLGKVLQQYNLLVMEGEKNNCDKSCR